MKKILSWMLALMMLAIPALAAAEAPVTVEVNAAALADQSFATKYLKEGQRSVTDITIEPGLTLLSAVPEEYQQAVQDLLAALKIEVVGQAIDQQAQGTLRFLMNDKDAANVTLALGDKGVYASSSFLGDTVVQLTPEDLQKLMDQLAQQMVASGQISQEDLDALRAGLADPQALIKSLIGNPDPTALLTALFGLVNPEDVTAGEVTELPEDVTIDATAEMTLVIRKEALTKVTTELAKLLWSMPVTQQLGAAAASQNGGEPLTEEKLVAALNKLPEALAEDLTVRMYTGKEGNPTQILMAPKILADGKETEIKFSAVTDILEDGVKISWSMSMPGNEAEMRMTGDMTVKTEEKKADVTYTITADAVSGEETVRVMTMDMRVTATMEDALRTVNMDVAAEARQEPEADPVKIAYTVVAEEKDLGDHAEETAKVDMTVQDVLVMTVNVDSKTDLAEAYIITDDAVRPAAMSEEELQTFSQNLSSTASSGLFQLLMALPESTQTMVFSLMNNASQQ